MILVYNVYMGTPDVIDFDSFSSSCLGSCSERGIGFETICLFARPSVLKIKTQKLQTRFSLNHIILVSLKLKIPFNFDSGWLIFESPIAN